MTESLLDFFNNQGIESFLSTFWILVFVEVPRFFLGGLVVLMMLLFSKRARYTPEDLRNIGREILHNGVSVVISSHNDAASLEPMIISLREQTVRKIQIIIVNDGSTDGTHNECLRLRRAKKIDTYIHLKARGGKASAVNLALSYVKYDFFVVTDADTSFDRDAFEIAAAYFCDPRVGAVGGNLAVRNYKASLAARVQQINYLLSITLGRIVSDMLGLYFVASGAFGFYRKAATESLGGWELGPGEDGDIATRLRLGGWKVRFSPYAVAQTDVPDTELKLIKQRLRWNRSLIRLRFRKYRWHVLNPFNANFNMSLAIGFFDIYIFTALQPFLFVAFLIEKMIVFGFFSVYILISVSLIFILLDGLKILLSYTISKKIYRDYSLLDYIPLYTFYNVYFLRFVRLIAISHELMFRGSYTDDYVPEKVRLQQKVY